MQKSCHLTSADLIHSAYSAQQHLKTVYVPKGFTGDQELTPNFPLELKDVQMLSVSRDGAPVGHCCLFCNVCNAVKLLHTPLLDRLCYYALLIPQYYKSGLAEGAKTLGQSIF